MIQLKPTQLYAVQVPESATDIKMNENELKYFISPRERHKVFDKNFELIGTYQSGKIDFDAGEYVEKSPVFNVYKDYNIKIKIRNYYRFKNPKDSFTSILEANQVPIMDNEKYVILKLK